MIYVQAADWRAANEACMAIHAVAPGEAIDTRMGSAEPGRTWSIDPLAIQRASDQWLASEQMESKGEAEHERAAA